MTRLYSSICLAVLVLACCAGLWPGRVFGQQVVDRVVAKVDDDVLLLSDLRELGQFQQLIEGSSQPPEKRLNELIDQWIAMREATAAQFAQPSAADIQGARTALEKELGGAQAFQTRQQQCGLTSAAIDRQLRRGLLVSRYLDYKFRPASQVESDTIEKYYNEQFVPEMKARGGVVPPLDSVRAEIRELLVQQQISEHAEQWLTEGRSRLKIETFLQSDRTPDAAHK